MPLVGAWFAASVAVAADFTFVALGDMPYGLPEKVYGPFKVLIAEINRRSPVFAIHVGDTKSGWTPCADHRLLEQWDFMNSFASAVIYTPGDNEWTDCHRPQAGGFDPLDRLQFIRAHYFPTAWSLGRHPIRLERQADVMWGFESFVENGRFRYGDVWVVTAHVVGSNNNFQAHLDVRDQHTTQEFFARDKANRVWLADSFDKATSTNTEAVVVAIQADMFREGFDPEQETFARDSGFKGFGETLIMQAASFKRPVLLIFGDSHEFRIFHPFPRSADNLTAVEVYGGEHMHAVEITVAPDAAAAFTFRPVQNPALPEPPEAQREGCPNQAQHRGSILGVDLCW